MESMIYRKKWPLFVFIAPAFLFLIIFLFYPFIVNIYNSFFTIKALGAPTEAFNNFDNYKAILTDKKLHEALRNTLFMMGAAMLFQVGIALVLAIFVDSIHRGAQLFRTVFFFPIVISATAIGLMFSLIYMTNGGLDQLSLLFGVKPIYWLSPERAFFMMCIPVIWQYVGFYFVILLTGLNNISEDIYEAAAIDGAGGFSRVRFITLPLLYNVIVTCLTLAVTGALKVFDLPWTLLPNGAQNTFLTGTYMYFITYQKYNIDYGATVAIIIVVLGVAAAQVCNTVFKPRND